MRHHNRVSNYLMPQGKVGKVMGLNPRPCLIRVQMAYLRSIFHKGL